jgi:hypothetical protein
VREPVLSDCIKKGGSVRSLLVAAAFVTAGFSTAAARDVITIGHATFDFDAPSSPLTTGQQAFFRQYKDAVNQHDEASLMALQDASMNSCAVVLRTSILQDLDKTIPDDAKVRFFDATEDIAKEMGFGDLAYLSAQPTAVLGIIGGTKSEPGKDRHDLAACSAEGRGICTCSILSHRKRQSTVRTEKRN